MMAQKNHKNKKKIVHHLPKKIIDFELLWRCISEIRRMNRILWRCMRGEIIKRNNRIIYISGMVEFRMFISVRTIPLLEFVTRDLEDVPCWTIWCLSWLTRIKTSYSVVLLLLSELTSLERERERERLIRFIRFILVKAVNQKEKRWSEMDCSIYSAYRKNIFLPD